MLTTNPRRLSTPLQNMHLDNLMSDASHGSAQQTNARILGTQRKEAGQRRLASWFRRVWYTRRSQRLHLNTQGGASATEDWRQSTCRGLGLASIVRLVAHGAKRRSQRRVASVQRRIAPIVRVAGKSKLLCHIAAFAGHRGRVWRFVSAKDYTRLRWPAPVSCASQRNMLLELKRWQVERDAADTEEGKPDYAALLRRLAAVAPGVPLLPATLNLMMPYAACPADSTWLFDENVQRAMSPVSFESWQRAVAKAFGYVRGGDRHYLCECAGFKAWLAELNATRAGEGKAAVKVHTLKNLGRGTRHNINNTFFVELVLNAPLFTRYLDELNRDDETRNKLALDAEHGFVNRFYMGEALARAVMSVTLIKPTVLLTALASAQEGFEMWKAVRGALTDDDLEGGTAHIALENGIKARVPALASTLRSHLDDTAKKRDAILGLFAKGDGIAKSMMRGKAEQMDARIFGNLRIAPKDHSADGRLANVKGHNMDVEAYFGRMKYVSSVFPNTNLRVASGVASLQLSGAFCSELEMAARARKRDRGKGAVDSSNKRARLQGEFTRLIDSFPEHDIAAVLAFAISKRARQADSFSDDLKAQEAETLARRRRDAVKQDNRKHNRAAKHRKHALAKRATTPGELTAMLAAASSAAAESAKIGGSLAGGKIRKRAVPAKGLARHVAKAVRAALVEQIRIRKALWHDDGLPAMSRGSRDVPVDELTEQLAAYIEAEPTNRIVPPLPDPLATKELRATTTELGRQLHIARVRQLNAARKDFAAAAPANHRITLRTGAILPPTVAGHVDVVGPLAEAGLGAGSCVWSGTATYKILDPFFRNQTGSDLVCLLYPVDKFEIAEEEAMRRCPGDFDGALLCEHRQVLLWLGLLDGEEEGGAE